jgi:haloacid dehalogenase superfamily, subfamily IA, variant 3 with third motif having DD or ED
MDGTLIDSIAAVEALWTRFATELGVSAPDVIEYGHGRPIVDTVAKFLPSHSAQEQSSISRRLMQEELNEAHSVVEIAGAAGLVSALLDNAVPIALVTSATRELALSRMHNAGVPIPPIVVTAEDVSKGKPAPDAYLLAAERLGVPIADCIVFEDAEAGLRAARASGANVIVVGEHLSPSTDGLARISSYLDMRIVGSNAIAHFEFAPFD